MSPKQEMDFKDFSIGCCQGLDKPTKRAMLAPEYDVLWGFFIGDKSTGYKAHRFAYKTVIALGNILHRLKRLLLVVPSMEVKAGGDFNLAP